MNIKFISFLEKSELKVPTTIRTNRSNSIYFNRLLDWHMDCSSIFRKIPYEKKSKEGQNIKVLSLRDRILIKRVGEEEKTKSGINYYECC
jgi:hypothetical protein